MLPARLSVRSAQFIFRAHIVFGIIVCLRDESYKGIIALLYSNYCNFFEDPVFMKRHRPNRDEITGE